MKKTICLIIVINLTYLIFPFEGIGISTEKVPVNVSKFITEFIEFSSYSFCMEGTRYNKTKRAKNLGKDYWYSSNERTEGGRDSILRLFVINNNAFKIVTAQKEKTGLTNEDSYYIEGVVDVIGILNTNTGKIEKAISADYLSFGYIISITDKGPKMVFDASISSQWILEKDVPLYLERLNKKLIPKLSLK